jgi:hypothetical protein
VQKKSQIQATSTAHNLGSTQRNKDRTKATDIPLWFESAKGGSQGRRCDQQGQRQVQLHIGYASKLRGPLGGMCGNFI